MSTIRVEVYSDVICPWCLIGHHRLKQAIEQVPEVDCELIWLPFELNPDMPSEGMDRQAYLDTKFGPQRAAEIYGNIARVLDQEGLDADTAKIKKTPNTFKAHRLLYLARQSGGSGEKARKLKLAMFDAYFRDGRDIGSDDVLLDCALKAGLDEDQTKGWLQSDEGAHETRQLEARARQIGVQGVPFFILNGKLGVSGAQPPEILADALRQAAAA